MTTETADLLAEKEQLQAALGRLLTVTVGLARRAEPFDKYLALAAIADAEAALKDSL